MRSTSITALLAGFFAAVLACDGRTQTTKPAADPGPERTAEAKTPEWPKLSGADSTRLKTWLKSLSSEKPETAEKAEAGIAKIGAAAAPRLIRSFAPRSAAAHPAIARLLDMVVVAEHAPLVAPVLQNKAVAARRWAAAWLATHHGTGEAEALEAAVANEEEDEQVLLYASLALGARKRFTGLDAAFTQCRDDWRSHVDSVARILAPARSPEAVTWAAAKIRDGDELDKVTALRMLRSLCPQSHVIVLKNHLDDSSHAVKKAAINALRVVVDGEPPLENLSVFQAIDQAKKWKARQ